MPTPIGLNDSKYWLTSIVLFRNDRERHTYDRKLVRKIAPIAVLHLIIPVRTTAANNTKPINILWFCACRAVILSATDKRKRLLIARQLCQWYAIIKTAQTFFRQIDHKKRPGLP